MAEQSKTSFVESIIDQMVSGDADPKTAVAQVLRGSDDLPDIVEMDLDSKDLTCPKCGNDDLSLDESQDVPIIVCENCDTGFVPADAIEESDDEEDSEEEELIEAEVDEDNPACPQCESPNLTGQIVEDDDGEEFGIVECSDCGCVFTPAEDEDEE